MKHTNKEQALKFMCEDEYENFVFTQEEEKNIKSSQKHLDDHFQELLTEGSNTTREEFNQHVYGEHGRLDSKLTCYIERNRVQQLLS